MYNHIMTTFKTPPSVSLSFVLIAMTVLNIASHFTLLASISSQGIYGNYSDIQVNTDPQVFCMSQDHQQQPSWHIEDEAS